LPPLDFAADFFRVDLRRARVFTTPIMHAIMINTPAIPTRIGTTGVDGADDSDDDNEIKPPFDGIAAPRTAVFGSSPNWAASDVWTVTPKVDSSDMDDFRSKLPLKTAEFDDTGLEEVWARGDLNNCASSSGIVGGDAIGRTSSCWGATCRGATATGCTTSGATTTDCCSGAAGC